MNVVNAVIGQRLEHHVKHPLAQVGPLHLRQRQADVVDRDRDAHVGVELREQRVGVFRMQQRVANRYVGIGQRFKRRRRIDDPGAGRKLGQQEVVAVGNQARLRSGC